LGRVVAVVALLVSAAGVLGGCGSPATTSEPEAPAASRQPSAVADAQRRNQPAGTISDRDGPSWRGRLGDTVQVDWYDQASGETLSERIAVLAVKRLPNPGGDDVPNEFGDDYGAYEWKYGIKVRLTSLAAGTARIPVAYQFLSLSDGSRTEDGVAGLGARGGPDPSRVGKSSVGWLYQWADEGFRPTEVLMPIGAWQARWSLE
jgi:hypothetical protein